MLCICLAHRKYSTVGRAKAVKPTRDLGQVTEPVWASGFSPGDLMAVNTHLTWLQGGCVN